MSRAQKGITNPAYTHGHTVGKFSPTYQSWATMLQRCNNPNTMYYKYYGGKGVTVCNTWVNSFTVFLSDMGERPKGTTLDRIDSTKGYTPTNCRWATKSEQSRHRTAIRKAHLQQILGACETPKTTEELISILGLHEETVRGMIRELRTNNHVETSRTIPLGKARMMVISTIGRN